jgi:diadenosine tetraphosphate (Ap4A) HIT family hydrolase
MNECRTCELVERRNAGDAPSWDCVARTPGWDVVHAFGTSLEGWTVLVVRRHIASVAELTDDEALELGPLIKAVSVALHEIVGCEKTYVAQFAEHPQHRHVHVHVIPRRADMPGDTRGPDVFSQIGVADDRCVPEVRMNDIAVALRRQLDSFPIAEQAAPGG